MCKVFASFRSGEKVFPWFFVREFMCSSIARYWVNRMEKELNHCEFKIVHYV